MILKSDESFTYMHYICVSYLLQIYLRLYRINYILLRIPYNVQDERRFTAAGSMLIEFLTYASDIQPQCQQVRRLMLIRGLR